MMTRARKPISRWLAAALALCLAGGLLAIPAHAVEYVDVDPDATGTLTIQMPNDITEGKRDAVYRADLAANGFTVTSDGKAYDGTTGVTIPVQLVKIADINAGGSYKASGLSNDIDALLQDFAANNTADAWRNATRLIMEALYDTDDLDYGEAAEGEEAGSEAADVIPTLKAGAEFKEGVTKTLVDGNPVKLTREEQYSTTVEVPVGLYLAAPEAVDSRYYHYTFTPSLLSVPMTNFLVPEEPADDYEWNDPETDWLYTYTADLKPMRENRMGRLELKKEVSSFNKNLGAVSFVFRVQYRYDGVLESEHSWDVDTPYGLTFEELATKGLVIENIPVGAVVKVTEEYDGASYEVKVGQDGYTIEIPALDEDSLRDYAKYNNGKEPDENQKWYDDEGKTTAWVYFKNDYQPDRFNPSLGIVNRWIKTGPGWELDNAKDNEGENNSDPAINSTPGANSSPSEGGGEG